jgi:hypothetical protein
MLFRSLSWFVVCVDPRAAGQTVELETCARAGSVTAVLRPNGRPVTWMQSDLVAHHPFMRALGYDEASFEERALGSGQGGGACNL